MNLLGRIQDLIVGVSTALQYRATVDGAIVSITGTPTVAVTNPSGVAVAIAEAVTVSGSVMTLTRTWLSAVTPANYLAPYTAVWSFVVAGVTHKRTQKFFLLSNLWESQVVEADITDLDASIKPMVANTALADWIREAWGDFWDMVSSKTFMHPSRWPADRFRQAHIEQTKYRLYAWSITRKADDRWEGLAAMHKRAAEQQVDRILADPSVVVTGADADVGRNRMRTPWFF
ncbi:MAG: hypothetical protein KJ587_20140 [Alphaproteobacteria bacterium]|nr:hypothetical protein [Alphaproteobacteria bacterium]